MIKEYKKQNGKVVNVVHDDFALFEKKQAIVDVIYCGICGTDYQKYIGMEDIEEWGHEIIGKTRIKNKEKLVTIRTTYPCNKCDKCKSGHREECSNWQRANFIGFANKIMVDNRCIIPIEDELDMAYALIEPLYVANALINHVFPEKDSIYTIIGNGTIGLLTAFLIKEKYGAEARIVGRRNPRSRKLFVDKIGADYYDISAMDKALSGSNKIIITAPYNVIPDVIKKADSYANITFNGISKQTKVEIEFDKWHFKNLHIWPAFPHPQNEFQEEIEIIKNNKDLLRSIITGVYSLEKIEKAFELLADKKNDSIKILINCNEVIK